VSYFLYGKQDYKSSTFFVVFIMFFKVIVVLLKFHYFVVGCQCFVKFSLIKKNVVYKKITLKN
jgi:hypothetical protein